MQAFSYGLFRPESALLVVIDIQERLLPAMSEPERLLKNACTLIAGCRALEIPIIITEQYPKGLGRTDGRILSALDSGADSGSSSAESSPLESATPQKSPESQILEKISFSIFGDEEITRAIASTKASDLLICGIESHVCVLQSVLHARKLGLNVWVAKDALSSRDTHNHQNALSLMAESGAHISNVESLLFGAMHTAKHKSFKAISALIK